MFKRCTSEIMEFKNYKVYNPPINIEKVVQVRKSKEFFLYETKEKMEIMVPIIEFDCGNNIIYKWVYSDDKYEERDDDYEKIVNNS